VEYNKSSAYSLNVPLASEGEQTSLLSRREAVIDGQTGHSRRQLRD